MHNMNVLTQVTHIVN